MEPATVRNFLFLLILLTIGVALTVRVRYGGGEFYEDLSTTPLLDSTQLETVLTYPEPIGSVAVSDSGRIFFTIHPESRPQGNKLLEWVAGAAVPFPSGTVQPHLFDTVLGITIDRQLRLWSIDHGRQGFGEPRILAFDLRSGDVVHDFKFRSETAPFGSFLQDLSVSADGRFVIISDGSILRKNPGLVVYDVEKKSARRILESHESVVAENIVIRNPIKDLSFLGGMFTLKGGVNGITIDPDDEWLYFAAINNSGLYRLRMEDAIDPLLPAEEVRARVERFSDKPLSDGLSVDRHGNIFITDVEHNAISIINDGRQLTTLVRSSDIRWPAAITFGPQGYLYVADSAFPELVLETKNHIEQQGPYAIFRLDTGHGSKPGRQNYNQ
jgi:sugar lactone lactonase YvrE